MALKTTTHIGIGLFVLTMTFIAVGLWLDAKSFYGNIFSELAGASLGIAITSIAIEPILKRAQEIERNNQQRRLHNSLSQILGFLVEALSGNPFHWSKHVLYCKSIDALLDDLRRIQQDINAEKFRLNTLQEKCVIEAAHEVCESIRSLSPVAFQLSGERGVLWLSLSNSVAQLSKLYPYRVNSVSTAARVIIAGQDEFSLAFCELIEHMLAFELAKIKS